MITKGIITSIDYNTNMCTVRLPLFEQAGNVDPVVNEATFSILPGIYNGYKVDDVVYVDFEDDQLNNPIIIGKLFINSQNESANSLGMINCASLSAKALTIPSTTKIVADPSFANNLEGGPGSYKTIEDILKKLQEYEDRIARLEDKLKN